MVTGPGWWGIHSPGDWWSEWDFFVHAEVIRDGIEVYGWDRIIVEGRKVLFIFPLGKAICVACHFGFVGFDRFPLFFGHLFPFAFVVINQGKGILPPEGNSSSGILRDFSRIVPKSLHAMEKKNPHQDDCPDGDLVKLEPWFHFSSFAGMPNGADPSLRGSLPPRKDNGHVQVQDHHHD
jgi:hypothetical protein